MNIYIIIGVTGIISGILCAQAGKKTLWTQTSLQYFDKAFWLFCIGQPGIYLTTWFLAELISEKNAHFGILLKK